MEEERKNSYVEGTQKWIKDMQTGVSSYDMEIINLQTLKILDINKGFLRCSFTVTNRVSCENGNWHPGSIATIIDNVGGAAIHSASGIKKASVDFSVSFFSTAKIHEEVIIEGKVISEKGRLSSILVEVRRKSNGELIALALLVAEFFIVKLLENGKIFRKVKHAFDSLASPTGNRDALEPFKVVDLWKKRWDDCFRQSGCPKTYQFTKSEEFLPDSSSLLTKLFQVGTEGSYKQTAKLCTKSKCESLTLGEAALLTGIMPEPQI
ncbi:hypothetical protein ACFE04_008635 [Oxalis oulophora]